MFPGIWTGGIVIDLPLHEAVKKLCGLGWRNFEASSEHLCEIDQSEAQESEIEQTKAVLSEFNATMPQAHALLHANVAHADPDRRETEISTVERHLKISAELGVKNVVVHPGIGDGYTTRAELKKLFALNVEGFSRLADYAGNLGLRIGIENLPDQPKSRGKRLFGGYIYEIFDVIEKVGSPALGITLDTSHANLSYFDIPDMVREIGDKMFCTHISDNNHSGDQHLIPGNGDINWTPVMKAFGEIGYSGIFNLEIPGARPKTVEMGELKWKYALNVTTWLVDSAKI